MAGLKLTDTAIKQSAIRDKDYKLTDGGGLYLLIKSTGTKCWRYAYRFAGKQKTLARGTYPAVSLKAAREALSQAKNKLVNNINPSQEKQRERRKAILESDSLFFLIAKEWWNHRG